MLEMSIQEGMRPKQDKTHEECHHESCCTCGGKVKPGMGKTNNTAITPMIAERIRKWAKPEFNQTILSYPVGLCMTCRRQLSECEKLWVVIPAIKAKWDAFKLQNIQILRGQDARTCCCDICRARRTKSKSVQIAPSRGEP